MKVEGNRTGRGCFVTGTDTGVGKTLVTAALTMALRDRGVAVGVMKPVETGVSTDARDSDAARLQLAAGITDPLDLISPYCFRPPLAPLAAAREAGLTIEASKIELAFEKLAARHTCMLVEGVGGVRVPIGEKFDVLELIRRLGLPVVVVGRTALGGINHALLTVDTLERHALSILAVVLNQTAPVEGPSRAQAESTATLLRQEIGCCVLGPLPYVTSTHEWRTLAATLSRHPELLRLADLLTGPGETP